MPNRDELVEAALRRMDERAGVGVLAAGTSDAELRLKCLAAAGDAAKLGLSHDIYQTADKYYRWVMGEKIEAAVELPFKTALIAMIEAELTSERSDIEKIREEMSEAFGIVEDRHWPQKPGDKPYTHEEHAAMVADFARAGFGDAGMAEIDRRMRETEDKFVQPIIDSLQSQP